MRANVIELDALPELLASIITTEKVRVSEVDGIVRIEPVKAEVDCTVGLRGMFAGDVNMTVDKFMQQKLAEKELDL